MAAVIDIQYRAEWDDGFGARGWKIESSIPDPRVIASTAFTGDVAETSVFVHDIVDHHLCGLSIGGHRSEAVAIFLHALRSGVPVEPSIRLMVDELLATAECGEELCTFLPADMLCKIDDPRADDRLVLEQLTSRYGKAQTCTRLVEHYYRIAAQGIPDALEAWSANGLENVRRPAIGRCLQRLIRDADAYVLREHISSIRGQATVGNTQCQITAGTKRWAYSLTA